MRRWLSSVLLGTSLLLSIASNGCEGSSIEPSGGSSSGRSGGSSSGRDGKGSSGETRGAGTVRIANFNVRNLFNDQKDSPIPNEDVVSTSVYQQHLSDIAKALRTVNADIVVLVEIENLNVIDDLRATPELEGRYEHRALEHGNDPRGINIGLISNVPIERVVSHKDESLTGELTNQQGNPVRYQWSRDLPEYHLNYEGNPFVLLGVHFKARVVNASQDQIKRDDDKRVTEARRTREIAEQLLTEDPSRPVLVLGDFNDQLGSPTTEAIRGSNPEFDNTMALLPEGERWTVVYGGNQMVYDDQWGSPGFSAIRGEDAEAYQFAVSDHKAVVANYTFTGD